MTQSLTPSNGVSRSITPSFFSDDEKNKMLPEAASINQDGSQDGLMEAANIPLQSKEEDQM